MTISLDAADWFDIEEPIHNAGANASKGAATISVNEKTDVSETEIMERLSKKQTALRSADKHLRLPERSFDTPKTL